MHIGRCYRYGKRQTFAVNCYMPLDAFDALVSVYALLRLRQATLCALAINNGDPWVFALSPFNAFTPEVE